MAGLQELAQPQYTEQNFIHGAPERIVEASDPEILVIWPHGDETLGARVGHRMYDTRPDLLADSVDYLCLNPAAAAQEPAVRDTANFEEPVDGYFVAGTDANRSYSPTNGPHSYEEVRATEVLELIEERGYNTVLDMHTTKSTQDPCFIISERYLDHPETRRIIAASRIGKIVVLPETVPSNDDPTTRKPLVTLGLIGKTHLAVSIEYSRPDAEAFGVEDTIEMIDHLLTGESPFAGTEREMYYVEHTLPKDLDFETIKNFEPHPDGYWPVLCSLEGDYRKDKTKDYSGFAATRYEVIVI
ncbi:MAG: hypothetical protein ABWY71_00090 [Candidatus Saccharimonadales bacterium]